MLLFFQQHALRLMAFGQIYKVLEMEPLPSNKPSQKYPWSDKEGVYLLDPLPFIFILHASQVIQPLPPTCLSSCVCLCLCICLFRPAGCVNLSFFLSVLLCLPLFFRFHSGTSFGSFTVSCQKRACEIFWHIIYLSGAVKLFFYTTAGRTVSETDKLSLKKTFKVEIGCLIFDTVALEKCL